jgi:hypothetical protein
MSAQVGTLQRTGFPRMIWPALAVVIVLATGIATVVVVTDDPTSSQTSTETAAITAETDRLTALAETFGARSTTADAARLTAIAESYGAPTRSMTTDSARLTAIAESFGSSGVVLGVTTPTELGGSLDGSTTDATAGASGPIGFHPLP